MKLIFSFLILCLFAPVHVMSQELSALARVDPTVSSVEDGWWGRTDLKLHLSQGVPFRVFTLDEPARLVADLAEPMVPREIGMHVDPNTGRVNLEIMLKTVGAEEFAIDAGTPVDPNWTPAFLSAPKPKRTGADRFVVVLDPGHGGIDPGAKRGEINEKVLMLDFAQTMAELLRRMDVDVVLTRETDVFVALQTRVAIAHQVEADLFISLHADNLRQGGAREPRSILCRRRPAMLRPSIWRHATTDQT